MRMLALVLLATSCLAQDVPQDVSAVKISSGGTVHGHAQWRNDVLYVDNGGKMLLTFGKAEVVSVQSVTGDEAEELRQQIEKRRAFAASTKTTARPIRKEEPLPAWLIEQRKEVLEREAQNRVRQAEERARRNEENGTTSAPAVVAPKHLGTEIFRGELGGQPIRPDVY